MMNKKILIITLCIVSLILVSGCGSENARPDTVMPETSSEILQEETTSPEQQEKELQFDDLVFDHSMELLYANQFSVDYYEGGYKYITIEGDQKFLLVPENADVPKTEEDVVILQQPLDRIYLVATAAMDYFLQLNSLERITLSSQKENNWYLEEARQAMEDGRMKYAGKYSTPDYELILSEGCDLAIENTMIYHTPDVLE